MAKPVPHLPGMSFLTSAEKQVYPGILPGGVFEKMEDLRGDAEEANAALVATSAKVRDLVLDNRRQQSIISELKSPSYSRNGRRQVAPADEIENAKRILERDEGRLSSLRGREADLQAVWSARKRLVEAIDSWHLASQSMFILPAKPVEPRLRKNENLPDAIARIRGDIRGLKADRQKTISAPIFSDVAKAQARDYVERLAYAGKPEVIDLVESDGVIRWPNLASTRSVEVEAGAHHAYQVFGDVRDGLPVVAWLHKDALVKAMEREIDAVADDANAITAVDRQRRLKDLAEQLVALEREEETSILMARSGGSFNVERRADADPVAVLQVVTVSADGEIV